MRLTVLGGSAAGPNPGSGCSGYLVRDGDSAIVVDLGPGTVPELRKHIEPRTLDAIVISHMHLDHVLDLATLRYGLKYAPNVMHRRLPVYLPPGGIETMTQLARAFSTAEEVGSFYHEVFDLMTYDPEQPLKIGSMTVTFAPAVHYAPCWAMRVTAESGHSLGYTADTGPAAPLASFFDGVNVLVAEAALLEPGLEPIASRGHLTGSEAGELAAAAHARLLLLTHIWLENGTGKIRDQAASAFRGRIEIASPGLMVDI